MPASSRTTSTRVGSRTACAALATALAACVVTPAGPTTGSIDGHGIVDGRASAWHVDLWATGFAKDLMAYTSRSPDFDWQLDLFAPDVAAPVLATGDYDMSRNRAAEERGWSCAAPAWSPSCPPPPVVVVLHFADSGGATDCDVLGGIIHTTHVPTDADPSWLGELTTLACDSNPPGHHVEISDGTARVTWDAGSMAKFDD